MNARADCTLSFRANFDAYAKAAAELRRALENRGVGPKPRHYAELVFEEIVSNIIRHGCANQPECEVEVSLGVNADAIVLDFQDNAPPFDPLGHKVAKLPASLEEAGSGGGLGLRLVRKASVSIDYQRTSQNWNHLIVTIAA